MPRIIPFQRRTASVKANEATRRSPLSYYVFGFFSFLFFVFSLARRNLWFGGMLRYVPGSRLPSSQQCLHDAQPFRVQRLFAHRLACTVVPIGCVARIAFLTVQVSSAPAGIVSFCT